MVFADLEIRNQWGTKSEPQPGWILGLKQCKHSQAKAKNLQFEAAMPASADEWNTTRCKWVIMAKPVVIDWVSDDNMIRFEWAMTIWYFSALWQTVFIVHSTQALQFIINLSCLFFSEVCVTCLSLRFRKHGPRFSMPKLHDFARQLSISDSNAR